MTLAHALSTRISTRMPAYRQWFRLTKTRLSLPKKVETFRHVALGVQERIASARQPHLHFDHGSDKCGGKRRALRRRPPGSLIFLASARDTAHTFDDFAPRFTGRHQVHAEDSASTQTAAMVQDSKVCQFPAVARRSVLGNAPVITSTIFVAVRGSRFASATSV